MLDDWLERSIEEGIVRERSDFMGLHLFGVEITPGRIGNVTLQNLGRNEEGEFILGKSDPTLTVTPTMDSAILIILGYDGYDMQQNAG